jgi:hypothetical protein
MRLVGAILFICCLCGSLSAQTDIPNSRKLRIEANPDKGVTPSNSSGLGLSTPSMLGKTPDLNLADDLYKRPVQMQPDTELKQAGHNLVLKPNIPESQRGKSEHFGDMYLGDVKTGSNFIGVVCRDHEYVDGDRVRIYVNGMVVEANIMLTGAFKGINVELDEGFNRLEFEALNQGSSGPNTAQIDVYDENGKLMFSNKWLLSTGSKASLVVVKEPE